MIEDEYDKFPVRFTEYYLKDETTSSYQEIDYDDELDTEKDSEKKYIFHFFQLNSMLKFAFRFYPAGKLISNIYIMDDTGDQEYEEFYRLSILNKLIPAFDIENNIFDWDFDFKFFESI